MSEEGGGQQSGIGTWCTQGVGSWGSVQDVGIWARVVVSEDPSS